MATSIPPHNAAELLRRGAAPDRATRGDRPTSCCSFVQGPDFPTGGIVVEPPAAIAEAYRTGRGSFRVRARWTQGGPGRGTWVDRRHRDSVPVPKSRLVEKMAELSTSKKLPLLADVRDESAEDVRLVSSRASRTVDAGDPDGDAVPAHRARDAASRST